MTKPDDDEDEDDEDETRRTTRNHSPQENENENENHFRRKERETENWRGKETKEEPPQQRSTSANDLVALMVNLVSLQKKAEYYS